MDGSRLGSIFLLEAGFGLFVSLLLVRDAPLGPFFFRMLGGAGAVAALGGFGLAARDAPLFVPLLAGSAVALAGYVALLRPLKTSARTLAIGASTLGSLTALKAAALPSLWQEALAERTLSLVSVAGSGLVIGTLSVAMTLGHWYLVVPNLDVVHLERANVATLAALGLKLACTVTLVLAHRGALEGARLFRPMGLFHLGTRGVVGFLFPIAFAVLVMGTLRHRNTRSATGILYASMVLVLIGEAVGMSLWRAYGFPL